MRKNENQLIKQENSIFIKIKTFLFNLFKRNDNKTIKKEEVLKPKKDIALDIYKKLISNKILVQDVPIEYLDIIKEFLLKEIELKKSKLNNLQTDIKIKSYEIEHLSKLKNTYSDEL